MLGCSHRSELKRCVNNFRRKTFFRLWHQFENAYHVGAGPLIKDIEGSTECALGHSGTDRIDLSAPFSTPEVSHVPIQ